ncbi:MAG: hypothetical protein L0G46_01305 [Kocuria sp.]|nr:hypothetical protein [Kocuria sp.]
MSNRAVNAYEDGEKPISKFTRQDLTDINSLIPEVEAPLTVTELKGMLKRWGASSWHHTSKRANKTQFYAVSALFNLEPHPDHVEPGGLIEAVDDEARRIFLLRLRAYRDMPDLGVLV